MVETRCDCAGLRLALMERVRRVVVSLLALAVFLPTLASARARWMTGVDLYVREACCCPALRKVAPPAAPTWQKVCCKLDKRSAVGLPPAAQTSAPRAVPGPVATVAFAPAAPERRAMARSISPRAQAPPPPTLLAQFRGLLL